MIVMCDVEDTQLSMRSKGQARTVTILIVRNALLAEWSLKIMAHSVRRRDRSRGTKKFKEKLEKSSRIGHRASRRRGRKKLEVTRERRLTAVLAAALTAYTPFDFNWTSVEKF